MDERPFEGAPKDLEHHRLALTSHRIREIFSPGDDQALIHLGISHNKHQNTAEQHSENLRAFQGLLECAREAGFKKIVLLSSANVYGPRADNPQFLTETAPLLAAGPFTDIRDLVEMDMLAQSFLWQHTGIETVILRPTHILGTVHNAPSNYLRLAVVPTIFGFDPMVQVVHEEDVAQAIVASLKPGVRGTFNLGGPPAVPLSQALKLLGRTSVSLPHGLAKLTLEGLFKAKMSNFPAPELDFIRYVCMVDDSLARGQLGYSPRFGLSETLGSVDAERWVA
mgnify:CR=1 FL=1